MSPALPEPPCVSVVMAVYHADDYLEESIKSILEQTFSDFEFIIVCDDPSQRTKKILTYYKEHDSRVKVFYGSGTGLVDAVNMGCHLAKGQYIARMDADDICVRDRFEKQIAFLEMHPKIGVCGAWMEVVDKQGKKMKTRRPPTCPEAIRFGLMFNCCIAQPTVIMRKDCYLRAGYYRQSASYVEDYDLWARLCMITQIASIPDCLVKYRYHETNISKCFSDEHFIEKKKQSFDISVYLIESTMGKTYARELHSFFKKWKFEEMMSVAEVMDMEQFIARLLKDYQDTFLLSSNEKKELHQYTAFLLLDLAFRVKDFSRLKALEYVVTAIRMDPLLLIQVPEKLYFEGKDLIINNGKRYHT